MQGKTAELLRAISNNHGRAVTIEEAALLVGMKPEQVGVMMWWLTQQGELTKLAGFPWWCQRWGVPRLWRSWG